MRIIFLTIFLFSCAANIFAVGENIFPPAPPREFRGAWLATVANIDWPSKPGLPVAQQKAELISLLDRAAQLHFNAIFFQVRTVGDAFYPSAIEPWSEYISGRQGQPPAPFYDPLALAISEAHKRGLQLHVWFNPFRAGHPLSKSPPAANHITRTNPELIWHYGDQTWLDPGNPASQARALAVVLDVVKRYNVDGVVIDDYFYPYPIKNPAKEDVDFPDYATWKKFGATSGLNRDDWRRDNVNRFVQKLSQIIKSTKPWVQFGVAPFGIWRPGNPASVRGFDAYQKIYADSRLWLARGWVDYFSPQLYWSLASPQQNFTALFDWWKSQNPLNRHVWPSLADFNVPEKKFSLLEIPNQIQTVRKKSDPGEIHFSLRSVLDNPGVVAAIRTQYFTSALVPPSPWIKSSPPAKPQLTVDLGMRSVHVRWNNFAGEAPRGWVLQLRMNGIWQTQIFPPGLTDDYFDNIFPDAISIRAVDRLGNLSEPAVWQKMPK